jgi:hypothetical protein
VLAASLALVATAALLTAARAARAPAPWSAPAAAAREDGVHVASVDLGLLGYTAPDAESFLNRASARLRAAPALRAFAWATADPSTPGDHESFAIDGRPVRGAYVSPRLVSDGYFGAMRVHLVRGRAARAGAAEAVIDGEAARFWGGADPIGSRLTILDATVTVVGVVDETASAGTVAARPRVYARLDPPFGQGTLGGALLRPLTLLVVPSGDPGAALDAARAAVEGAAPRATLVWGGALADRLARGGDVRRATIAWSTALAALTGLAAVAVAGVETRDRALGELADAAQPA